MPETKEEYKRRIAYEMRLFGEIGETPEPSIPSVWGLFVENRRWIGTLVAGAAGLFLGRLFGSLFELARGVQGIMPRETPVVEAATGAAIALLVLSAVRLYQDHRHNPSN